MSNYQQAPKILYNQQEKLQDTKKWGKTIRTHELEAALMNKCDNLAELKYMLFLTGNAGDGSFKASKTTIMERTGLSESSITRARKALAAKGFIECVEGQSITIHFNKILGEEVDSSPPGSQVDSKETAQKAYIRQSGSQVDYKETSKEYPTIPREKIENSPVEIIWLGEDLVRIPNNKNSIFRVV